MEILKNINNYLCYTIKTLTVYDFVGTIDRCKTLLVGEGNLSFTCALARLSQRKFLRNVTASTYEPYEDLSEVGQENAKILENAGFTVVHGMDATKIHTIFPSHSFDVIIFQFPNVASRETVEGLNPNYVLVRNFIQAASCILKKCGTVLITIVDTEYYKNIFKLRELCEIFGFNRPAKYSFYPNTYPKYEHTTAHGEDGVLEGYDAFATYALTKGS